MSKHKSALYIVGAGFAGQSLAKEIQRKEFPGKIEAFLDDNRLGDTIDGVPVLGPIHSISKVLKPAPNAEAIIAIPSESRTRISEIYNDLKAAGFASIKILPSVSQIIEGNAHLIQTRNIDPQDLLGRDPVPINLSKALSYLRGKRVLITGAGGSIGSELARQLLSGGAERLYVLGHGENSIYEIHRELQLLQEEGVGEKATIIPIIGELQDPDFTEYILERLKADVVFHCAAYKHVPLMEENTVSVIKNNVFGTLNLVNASKKAGVKRFVLISTDKAVDPISMYGASKKLSEDIVLSQDSEAFMVVRFGNVLGSRGSIVPLFQKQIKKGGPLTLTHEDTSRFFMTIPEAASLVLKAGGMGTNGELYVLDMGTPVKIRDLAEQMIRFYGYTPEKDIPIVVTGLRAGEKLHEQLWHEAEPEPTSSQGILHLPKKEINREALSALLEAIYPACHFVKEKADIYRDRKVLRQLVKGYVPKLLGKDDETSH